MTPQTFGAKVGMKNVRDSRDLALRLLILGWMSLLVGLVGFLVGGIGLGLFFHLATPNIPTPTPPCPCPCAAPQ